VSVQLTNLDRVLWPDTGMTKASMVRYYETVADVLLPHVRERPMTLGRFPTGVHEKGWYQTNCRGAPSWMEVAEIPGRRGAVHRMCLVNDAESLLWVANQGTIELHPYLSAASAFDEPVVLVIDLDPGAGVGLIESCRAALVVRDSLAADGLPASVKTSGSSGIHLFVGLAPGATFAATRAYARALARDLVQARPNEFTDAFPMAARTGKILIDWRQNERSRSMIAPYSLRATPWPLVSAPLTWEEVRDAAGSTGARPLVFGPADVVRRMDDRGDLFAQVLDRSASVPPTPSEESETFSVPG
jgi:bifunctional non-homologous end joining protein LigD